MHRLANIDDDARSRGGASSRRRHHARSDVDARTYDGADGRHNPAYERPIAITEPWLQASWLYAAERAQLAQHAVACILPAAHERPVAGGRAADVDPEGGGHCKGLVRHGARKVEKKGWRRSAASPMNSAAPAAIHSGLCGLFSVCRLPPHTASVRAKPP